MFTYGVIYATVSLSCTIPVFLVAVVGTFRADSFVAGVAVLLAYAAGMGLVLTALAVALALAKDGMVRRSRSVLPWLNRISGVLLVVAGAYVTWYGYVEIRVLDGDLVARGPVDAVARWSGEISTFVEAHRGALALAAAVVILVGALWWLVRRRADAGRDDRTRSQTRRLTTHDRRPQNSPTMAGRSERNACEAKARTRVAQSRLSFPAR